MKLSRDTRRFAGGWKVESIGEDLVPAVVIEGRVVPERVRLSHPGADGQPAIVMELEMRDGVAQCRGLHVESVTDGRDVRPVDLEVLSRRLYGWIGEVFAVLARRVVKTGPNTFQLLDVIGPDDRDAFNSALVAVTRARRPRKLDRSFLLRVADVYRENIAKAPTKAVAEAFSVSHRTAATYVKQARDLELMPQTTKGKKLI